MAAAGINEKPIGENMWELLQTDPENYDVCFCVGPQKIMVRAVKFVLKAESPVMKHRFKYDWAYTAVHERNGIPLPDMDPTAFQLFIKLLTLDMWSTESLNGLNLSLKTLFSLLDVCRRFSVVKGIICLVKATNKFNRSFNDLETGEFLEMSRDNFETILSCDDLPLDELEIFQAALRWAKFKCQKAGLGESDKNMRKVLGGCLYQIAFPALTFAEFTNVCENNKKLLSVDESRAIYNFIGLGEREKRNFDFTKLRFRTTRRRNSKQERTEVKTPGQWGPKRTPTEMKIWESKARPVSSKSKEKDSDNEAGGTDDIFQFKITLDEATPPIWRRVQVPNWLCFDDLHKVLNGAMGWKGYHLYEFRTVLANGGELCVRQIFDDEFTFTFEGVTVPSCKPQDSKQVKISDIFTPKLNKMTYEYDFGDGWEHTVVFEGILPRDKEVFYPRCIAGQRACPPEDCGAVPGYEELLVILADPQHELHKERKDWLHGVDYGNYDPEHFDLQISNNNIVSYLLHNCEDCEHP